MACNEKNPLQRDGASQSQRFLKALDPASAPIEELGLRDWLQFAAAYAKKVNYFSVADSNHPQGDWSSFFIENAGELDTLVKQAEDKIKNARQGFADAGIKSDIEPHLALFMCFVLLLQHSTDSLNELTGRHLDFYYKQVLQLRNRPEVPDKVHVIFELAKNLSGYLLEGGSLLDAGKDKSAKSRPLAFATESELAINKASIAALKSFYRSASANRLAYADVTNSLDGLGTPIKDDPPKWNAFGNDGWPAATMGFAVASKVLLLSEGERAITLTLTFDTSPGTLPVADMPGMFKVFLTSEKDWLQASFAGADAFQQTAAAPYQLTIKVTIPPKEKAIVPYNKAIHKENYNTGLPVMRLLVKAQGAAYDLYVQMASAGLSKIGIDVAVTGMKNLVVENDNGPVDPSKPFAAFGAQPRNGSNLYIGSTEIFQKHWTKITPNISWKNVPDDLPDYYTAYRKDYLEKAFSAAKYDITADNESNASTGGGQVITSSDDFTADVTYLRDGKWYPDDSADKEIKLFSGAITIEPDGVSQASNDPLLFANLITYFTTTSYNYTGGNSGSYQQGQNEKAMMTQYSEGTAYQVLGFPGFISFGSGLQTQTGTFSAGAKDNFIRITLTRDFLHSAYPKLYAAALSKSGDAALLPNEPYTPQISALTVDYTASAGNDVNNLSTAPDILLGDYLQREVQFFHETPFGQKEQHPFLKSQLDGLIGKNISVMPQSPALAALYIGIAGIANGSIVSILFQVAEGSEDPTAPAFSSAVKPAWYFLSGNEWLTMDKTAIVSDDTNNFLRPGIIQIMIPQGASTANTFLDNNLTWLAVELPASVNINSTCKFISINTQAALAQFADNDNELSHLADGIAPGTIAKLVSRLPQIKSVSQPYASFGGALPEDDNAFRIRISERLRHKHRPVNIWDYEHLVLSYFPQVYRVKCLNHTYSDQTNYCELSPGSVRVVVIPDIHNKNIFDPFKPMISTNTLSEIEKYLSALANLHVDLKVINPEYQEITLDFGVKFYGGLDKNLYAKKLNEDVISYLSPWAFNQDAEIDFGGTLYKSVVIRFIEELPYVDYIANFRMYFTGSPADPDVLQAINSKAILVSAKQHIIDTTAIPVCP
ncbi:MAG: baseplate J/gp47 family protein [Mucilaginibacter sp.]